MKQIPVIHVGYTGYKRKGRGIRRWGNQKYFYMSLEAFHALISSGPWHKLGGVCVCSISVQYLKGPRSSCSSQEQQERCATAHTSLPQLRVLGRERLPSLWQSSLGFKDIQLEWRLISASICTGECGHTGFIKTAFIFSAIVTIFSSLTWNIWELSLPTKGKWKRVNIMGCSVHWWALVLWYPNNLDMFWN